MLQKCAQLNCIVDCVIEWINEIENLDVAHQLLTLWSSPWCDRDELINRPAGWYYEFISCCHQWCLQKLEQRIPMSDVLNSKWHTQGHTIRNDIRGQRSKFMAVRFCSMIWFYIIFSNNRVWYKMYDRTLQGQEIITARILSILTFFPIFAKFAVSVY